jgi:hypothetical protein
MVKPYSLEYLSLRCKLKHLLLSTKDLKHFFTAIFNFFIKLKLSFTDNLFKWWFICFYSFYFLVIFLVVKNILVVFWLVRAIATMLLPLRRSVQGSYRLSSFCIVLNSTLHQPMHYVHLQDQGN